MDRQQVKRYCRDGTVNQCRFSGPNSQKRARSLTLALSCLLIASIPVHKGEEKGSEQIDPVLASSFFAKSHQNKQQQQQLLDTRSDRVQYLMANESKTDIVELIKERHESELPEQTSDHNPNDEIFLKAVDNFFNHKDEMDGVYSVSDLGLMALIARGQAVVYADLYTHHYDNPIEMRRAYGGGVDNAACIRQLEHLVQRTRRQEIERYDSKDLNLFQLFDTWGRTPAGLLLGNVFFEGMHDECLRMKIKISSDDEDEPNGSVPTRYCVLTVKHNDWPRLDEHDLFSLKAGICIPKTCDSSNYKNKYDLIMRLAQYQLRPIEIGQIKFNKLHCLPDEDSPMRSILHNPKSLLVLVALCLWLSTLLFATWKHHQLTTTSQKDLESINNGVRGKLFGLTNIRIGRRRSSAQTADSTNSQNNNKPDRQSHSFDPIKIYELLSITNNLRLLFDTSKESSLMQTGQRLKAETKSTNGNQDDANYYHRHNTEANGAETSAEKAIDENANKMSTNTTTNHKSPPPLSSNEALQGQSATGQQTVISVDLRCIEGIKVLAMMYVIMGHIMMCISTFASNTKELVDSGSVAFFLVNLVPAFAVNAFFTITGLLTCYLLFKQHQTYSFITSPGKWLAFIMYRYLRIMPMYALVVLYCKYLAKFTGSGPLWDYGTSSLGQRRMCEQESWWWTLTFTTNFLRPMQHCVPSGWYLSNDFQFFLVTPIFLAALFKRPLIGRVIVLTSIAASMGASFYSIFSSELDDLRPIANFAPHGFKTYVSHFSSNYTNPQYRIPAYLIGLLIGHQLYLFDAAAASLKRLQTSSSSSSSSTANNSSSEPGADSGWSAIATPVCVFLVALCCVTPVIGSNLTFTKWGAKFMVALMMPVFHVLFSLAIGIYLYMATTGHGSKTLNKLLSAPHWKPLARLSLCAVLVNIETINYIIQGSSYQYPISNTFHIAMNCLCILATYLVATIVCILFEAPIRGALNAILTLAIKKAVAASKKSTRPISDNNNNKEKIF